MRDANSPAAVQASRAAHGQASLKSDLKKSIALPGKIRRLTEESKVSTIPPAASLHLSTLCKSLHA
jgi:hypothetical protein